MRKFKLIKKLPFEGSPDMGYISTERLGEEGAHYWNHNWFHPEDYPECWQEVKDEFPKIISFRSLYLNSLNVILRYDGEKCISRSDGMDPKYTISYSAALVDPKCEIYQVAVSETEVFTLGDKVKHPFNDSFDVISKFIICNDPKRDVVWTLDRPDMIGKIVANVGNYFGNCNIEVSRLEKAPEVLFVTEDGVEMLDGDKFYYISIPLEHFSNCYSGYAQEGSAVNTNYKYFSTVEAAKKYFDDNKPIYSKKTNRRYFN